MDDRMKVLLLLMLSFALGFLAAVFWENDRDRHVSEKLTLAKQLETSADEALKKDRELLKRVRAGYDKIAGALGLPPQETNDLSDEETK
jgi:hypothetical protein